MHFTLSKKDEKKYLSLFEQHKRNLDYLIYVRDIIWKKPGSSINTSKDNNPFEKRSALINSIKSKNPFPNESTESALTWDTNLLLNKTYENNPYLKAIKNLSFSKDGWSLTNKTLKAYSLFPKEEEYMMGGNYLIRMNLGFFESDYIYPSISLYDNEWMSLNPYEIRTMEIPIQLAKGKVLTLGLGLGYFAYMAHLKEEVKEVHIVEMDLELIKIFNEYLLPLFPYKEKIHIHKADAFYFINNIKDNDYNLIFSDLWHDVSDGLTSYLKLKKVFNEFKTTQCLYWIEDAILTYLKLLVIGVIKDEYYRNETDYDELQVLIKQKLEDYSFSSAYQIDDLLNIKGLNRLFL